MQHTASNERGSEPLSLKNILEITSKMIIKFLTFFVRTFFAQLTIKRPFSAHLTQRFFLHYLRKTVHFSLCFKMIMYVPPVKSRRTSTLASDAMSSLIFANTSLYSSSTVASYTNRSDAACHSEVFSHDSLQGGQQNKTSAEVD